MSKNYWHAAFCAALRLELMGNPSLEFMDGFKITEMPLETDMLIVNKSQDVEIKNEIGEFFEGNNLIEFKSVTDHGFDQFSMCQALSYAYYYCKRFKTWDVTLTIISSRTHFNLLKWMTGKGFECKERHEGIYTVEGMNFFKVQLVIMEEIDSRLFVWLSSLTDSLTEDMARDVVTTAHGLTENEQRHLAREIIQVITKAHVNLFEKIKEDEIMASALMELMKPEVEKYAEEYAEGKIKNYEKERGAAQAIVMINHGDDNEYIRLVTNMSDEEIDALRESR